MIHCNRVFLSSYCLKANNEACNSRSLLFETVSLLLIWQQDKQENYGGWYTYRASEFITTLKEARVIANAAAVIGSLVWNTRQKDSVAVGMLKQLYGSNQIKLS